MHAPAKPTEPHRGPDAESSLDPHEITVELPHSDGLDQSYRFRNCHQERDRWLKILPRIEGRPKRIERFNECGTRAWLQWSPSRQARRVIANCCRQRHCPACRSWHARRTRSQIAYAMTGSRPNDWKLVTLTKRHSSAPLAVQLDHLAADFRRLRQRQIWRSAVAYGYAVIEITWSAETNQWHPHLHILARSRYIPQRDLSQNWRSITHGSFIVDIRAVKQLQYAINYVTAYVCKPPSATVFESDDLLAEWYAATTARRSLIAFGTNRPYAPLEEWDGFPDDWEWEQPLSPVLEAANAGDPKALAVLNTIAYTSPLATGDPHATTTQAPRRPP